MIIECPKCGSGLSDRVLESFFCGENSNPVCEYCKCNLREHILSKKDEERWGERFKGLNPHEVKFREEVSKELKKVKEGIGKKVDSAKEYFY